MAGRDIRGLDIALLRAFEALMRERSVSRAATRLFLSQPAVSAALARLRDVFADPLFTRTPHGVEPTPRAVALAPRIERVLGELTRLLETPDSFDVAASARIFRIGGSDHASRTFLPPLLVQLNAAGSAAQIYWQPVAFSDMAEQLRRGDIDLALWPKMSPPEEVEHLAMYSDDYCFAARRDHPLFADGVTLNSFCAVPHAFLGYGTSVLDDHIDQQLARAGLQRHAQVAVTSFHQLLDVLARSDHAAVLPSVVARAHAQHLCLHPLPFDVPRYTLYICWSRRAASDPAVQWLREALASIARSAVRLARPARTRRRAGP